MQGNVRPRRLHPDPGPTSPANATTRCGFQTVRNLSAPLPCDFVLRPSLGAWACTKRLSSLVRDGGNCSSLFADLQNPSNCFSILIRQVSRPGVKPDMVFRVRARAAAASPVCSRARLSVSRAQACHSTMTGPKVVLLATSDAR